MRSLENNKRGYRHLKPGYPLFVYLSRSLDSYSRLLDSYLGTDGGSTAPVCAGVRAFRAKYSIHDTLTCVS